MDLWEVRYRESAKTELEAVIRLHPDLKGILIQRLQALENFPPERWFRVRRQNGTDVFVSDGQIVRISGQVDFRTKIVWVHQVTVGRKR